MKTIKDDSEFKFGVKHQAYNAEMRSRREAKGLLQRELGEMVGLGVNTISNYECFRDWPNRDRGEKIAVALETDYDTLFPEWLREFKLTRSTFSTEHIITERLLPQMVNTFLPSGMEKTEEKIDRHFLRKNINKALKLLSDRERKVIEMRFGLGGEEPQTYEKVGRKFKVTRERIRQIEAKALRKLKHPTRKRLLGIDYENDKT
jgi:transcriptional regulator with XRE-family HTH domain